VSGEGEIKQAGVVGNESEAAFVGEKTSTWAEALPLKRQRDRVGAPEVGPCLSPEAAPC